MLLKLSGPYGERRGGETNGRKPAAKAAGEIDVALGVPDRAIADAGTERPARVRSDERVDCDECVDACIGAWCIETRVARRRVRCPCPRRRALRRPHSRPSRGRMAEQPSTTSARSRRRMSIRTRTSGSGNGRLASATTRTCGRCPAPQNATGFGMCLRLSHVPSSAVSGMQPCSCAPRPTTTVRCAERRTRSSAAPCRFGKNAEWITEVDALRSIDDRRTCSCDSGPRDRDPDGTSPGYLSTKREV